MKLILRLAILNRKVNMLDNLITPQMVKDFGIELRGGDNASRQINSILPPGSACGKLVRVEVYTPSGNWSSFRHINTMKEKWHPMEK